jgi:folate-dependent phosphoribosylglycinamide formyltransferase PurN
VVVGRKAGSSHAVFNYLNSRLQGCTFVFEPHESRSAFIKRRIKRLGVFRVASQIAFQSVVVPLLTLSSRARLRQVQREFELDTRSVDGHEVTSINAEDAVNLIERLRPAIIVVAGTRIIGKRFLERVRCPIVNIHAGITPVYRGVHGGYWALVDQRPELCGVTVHLVDAGIDTGGVLKQALIQPSRADNFVTYPWIQLGVGLRLLVQLLPDLVAGRALTVKPLAEDSHLRTHPTICEYCRHRALHGVK